LDFWKCTLANDFHKKFNEPQNIKCI
jgi:hypothetical protein